MALLRDNQTIVVKEEVLAQYSNIRSFTVDVETKKIIINMEYGDMVSGKFVPVQGHTRAHVIEDRKESQSSKGESLTVVSGKIALLQTPTANLKVESALGQLYFEGQDYISRGNTITSLTIPDATQVKISYNYIGPTTTDFSNVATSPTDGSKNLYQNIKKALWDKLIELGYEKGTVE